MNKGERKLLSILFPDQLPEPPEGMDRMSKFYEARGIAERMTEAVNTSRWPVVQDLAYRLRELAFELERPPD